MSQTLIQTPAIQAVWRRQFRVVGLAVWPFLAIIALGGGALLLFAVGDSGRITLREAEDLVLAPVYLAALLAPLAVWRGEGLFKGPYLLSAPIDRRRHMLLRIMAGWAWLMAAIVAYFIYLGILVVGFRGAVVLPAWQWLVPLLAASIFYFGASAAFANPRRAVVLVLAVLVALPVFGLVADDVLEAGVRWLVVGPVGLDKVLIPESDRDDRAATVFEWLGAGLTWLGLASAALWAALRQYRET